MSERKTCVGALCCCRCCSKAAPLPLPCNPFMSGEMGSACGNPGNDDAGRSAEGVASLLSGVALLSLCPSAPPCGSADERSAGMLPLFWCLLPLCLPAGSLLPGRRSVMTFPSRKACLWYSSGGMQILTDSHPLSRSSMLQDNARSNPIRLTSQACKGLSPGLQLVCTGSVL